MEIRTLESSAEGGSRVRGESARVWRGTRLGALGFAAVLGVGLVSMAGGCANGQGGSRGGFASNGERDRPGLGFLDRMGERLARGGRAASERLGATGRDLVSESRADLDQTARATTGRFTEFGEELGRTYDRSIDQTNRLVDETISNARERVSQGVRRAAGDYDPSEAIRGAGRSLDEKLNSAARRVDDSLDLLLPPDTVGGDPAGLGSRLPEPNRP